MKKLSTLVCFMLAGGFAYSQQVKNVGPVNPANVNKKSAIEEKRGVEHNPNGGSRAIIWSDDFSVPANWTMTNTSNPPRDFVIGTALPSTLTSQGFDATINSTSGGNFAYIDSDGAGTTATQDAIMVTTNAIDLSAVSSVEFSFQNYHRRYLETHYVTVSTDNGVTWTDIEVNDTYPTSTTSPNAETVSVNLTCIAAGFSQVKIGFRYVGAWDWFWAIDDVVLQDAPANDIKLFSANYNCVVPIAGYEQNAKYTIFPTSQIMGMAFTAYLQNAGSATQNNVALNVAVNNPSNVTVYTGNATGSTLGVCSGTTKQDSVMTYTPTAVSGQYNITYLANYDNILLDGTPLNNVDTLPFWIDDNTYARDDNTYRTSGLWNGAGTEYVIGNVYQIISNETLYSIDAAYTGSTDAGVIACAQLYEIDATTGDFILVAETCGGTTEMTVQASNISSSGSIVWAHNLLVPPVTLNAGTDYIAAIRHYGGPSDLVLMQGGTGADTTTVFILDTDATWYYMTSVPMIRMNFDAAVGVADINSNGLQVSQNIPNPTNGSTTVNITIANAADLTFEIVDLTGKIVMTIDLGNRTSGEHNLTFDASALSAGVYYYTVTANGVKVTKKMIITE